jgi:hypothetical protein
MIVPARRLRSIGWLALLLLCSLVVMAVAFRVNALRSQVHRAEVRIVALQEEKMYLETEFETRANQQQLKTWNDVDFGYVAPTADQYLENERQLASFSKPAEAGAPEPIRVASMDDSVVAAAAFPAMVSPLTGKRDSVDEPAEPVDHAAATALLGERLATVRDDEAAPAHGSGKDADKKAGDKKIGKSVEKTASRPSTSTSTKAKSASKASMTAKPVKLAMKDVKTKK